MIPTTVNILDKYKYWKVNVLNVIKTTFKTHISQKTQNYKVILNYDKLKENDRPTVFNGDLEREITFFLSNFLRVYESIGSTPRKLNYF